MKTIRSLLMPALFVLAFSACEEEELSKGKVTPPVLPDEKFQVNFQLESREYIEDTDFLNNKITKVVELEGKGKSDYLGFAKLKMNHKNIIDVRKGENEFRPGNFTVTDQSGDEFHGNYTLGENHQMTGEKIHARITNGTGKYHRSFGSIEIKLDKLVTGKINASTKVSLYWVDKANPEPVN